MPTMLTARGVAKLKPAAKPYYVNDHHPKTTGLAVRVATDGSKTWSLRYRIRGRLRRLTFASSSALTLADARSRARDALKLVSKQIDPAQQKADDRTADTVGTLAKVYIDKYARPTKRSWKNDDRLLDTEVLPHWKHRAAAEIKRRDVRELIEAVAERGPILANRVRAVLHTMFEFAMTREIVEANPVAGTTRPGVEQSRDRVLSDDELRSFWTATGLLPLEMQAFWRLRLLTAQRGGEIEKMRWSDVDLDAALWTIPAADTKNKRIHLVPLSVQVLAILRMIRVKADQILAARQARNDDRPQPIVYVLAGARGNRQRSTAAGTFGIDDFRGHDLRRTAATNMRKAGVPSGDISRVLNHVEGGPTATRAYDRYDGAAEKRIALDTWARTLMAIIEQKDATVLAFSRA